MSASLRAGRRSCARSLTLPLVGGGKCGFAAGAETSAGPKGGPVLGTDTFMGIHIFSSHAVPIQIVTKNAPHIYKISRLTRHVLYRAKINRQTHPKDPTVRSHVTDRIGRIQPLASTFEYRTSTVVLVFNSHEINGSETSDEMVM